MPPLRALNKVIRQYPDSLAVLKPRVKGYPSGACLYLIALFVRLFRVGVCAFVLRVQITATNLEKAQPCLRSRSFSVRRSFRARSFHYFTSSPATGA